MTTLESLKTMQNILLDTGMDDRGKNVMVLSVVNTMLSRLEAIEKSTMVYGTITSHPIIRKTGSIEKTLEHEDNCGC